MGEKATLIMVTTGGRDDAERLGEALVVEHLAASCSVVPTVHSFYYMDGQLQREHEALLMVTTLESRSGAVQEFIRSHHAYKIPEIMQVPIDGGSQAFLDWVEQQVANQGSGR